MTRFLETVGTQIRSQNQLHIAGRETAASGTVGPEYGPGHAASPKPVACLKAVPMPVRTGLPEAKRTHEPVPIWLAVLCVEFPYAKHNGQIGVQDWTDAFFSHGTYTNTNAKIGRAHV